MLVMAPRAVEVAPAPSHRPAATASQFKPVAAASSAASSAANASKPTALPFQSQCKSAVALVNERRIDFVRARNVRVIGRLDESASDAQKPKKPQTKQLVAAETVERLLLWQRSKKIGPGFANLGNTCYLNSVLQCLSYTPSFAQFLLDKDVFASFNGGALVSAGGQSSNKWHKKMQRNGTSNAGGNAFCSVRAMSRLLQSVHGNNAVRVLQPKELVMNVRHISKSFRIGRQEDSHEFFRLLLDSMQRSCLKKAHIKSETHAAASTTFVHRVFGGKLKNSLKCAKCGYVSERHDDFLDLSLEIAHGVNSVKGALRHFTAVETLDDSNAWKCTSCGKPSRAEKGLTIAECPNVLMIQLKRFDLMFGKIKRHIEFPRSLDISSGMSKNCEDRRRGRTKYDLHAVLVHAGYSTDCGHYYAFVKGSSGQWYEMNDDTVRWVSLDTVLQQKAYMLFYSRVLPPSERPKPKDKEVDEVKAKAKEVVEATKKQQEEVPAKVLTTPKPLLSKTKELDMNGFLASLKTTVATGNDNGDKPLTVVSAKTSIDKSVRVSMKHKTVVTFQVKASSPAPSSNTKPSVVHPRLKRSLAHSFSGRVGRLYRFRPVSWKSCPSLSMTQSVEEFPVEAAEAEAKAAPAAVAAPASKTTRVPFDPRHLKNVGVRNAALFGREVDKWTGETDVESTETTSGSDATHEPVDRELAAKHDRVLNSLKQEEWKHRNAGRQDYWDETLDMGKVKKVKKRKEFIPNEGRQNQFQTALMRKKKEAKRQRTA